MAAAMIRYLIFITHASSSVANLTCYVVQLYANIWAHATITIDFSVSK